ncbi:hypothetical protein JCM11641_005451 [Rhodosporidiobolus odoratus]
MSSREASQAKLGDDHDREQIEQEGRCREVSYGTEEATVGFSGAGTSSVNAAQPLGNLGGEAGQTIDHGGDNKTDDMVKEADLSGLDAHVKLYFQAKGQSLFASLPVSMHAHSPLNVVPQDSVREQI